jgi:hypothetical protein
MLLAVRSGYVELIPTPGAPRSTLTWPQLDSAQRSPEEVIAAVAMTLSHPPFSDVS